MLFIIDTCQAASMFRPFYSPNIVATGSSSVSEDSLSVSPPPPPNFLPYPLHTPTYIHTHMQHHLDSAIGVHVIDRWTYYALEFLEKVSPGSKSTLAQFVSTPATFRPHQTPINFLNCFHSLTRLIRSWFAPPLKSGLTCLGDH